MLARCISVYYQEGEFSLFQGVSGKRAGRVRYGDGSRYENRGYGWGSESKSSRLIVEIELYDSDQRTRYKVWIDRFFKDELGRLTEKRRKAICAAMPAILEVELQYTRDGEEYYTASESELKEWLLRTGLDKATAAAKG